MTTTELRRLATELGAVSFGVTSAAPFQSARQTLDRHLANGMAGPLHFTYQEPEVSTNVTRSFPWARRIVVFAHGYLGDSTPASSTGAVVARFATRDQYEAVRRVAAGLRGGLVGAGARAEILIDDNRLVDRAAAARAGVGWLGRSTMLLAPGAGPWMLIGSVVTDADLEETSPMRRGCGTCVDCIPACPTGAITPSGLDARKCISTWLQAPGAIPHWVRPLIERRIYGCDDCLTACPPGLPAMSRIDVAPEPLPFHELLSLGDEALIDRFDWFYVPHREARYLRRNLLIAAGNSGEPEAVEAIAGHLAHRSSLVRGHAYWALARSLGIDAWEPLRDRLGPESSPDALVELAHALAMLRVPTGG